MNLPHDSGGSTVAGSDSTESQQDWNSKFLELVRSGFVLSGGDAANDEPGPFARAAEIYRQKGWRGTIPLPPGKKHPPPSGWTGRNAQHPGDDQIAAWRRMSKYQRGNIALHLGLTQDGKYEVIGIDVDDYCDKCGGRELKELEAKYGALPATYISTSRALPSGIRFYRVPVGYSFIGKAASGIDVIQRAHRYAVVWPSWNPHSQAGYGWLGADGKEVAVPEDLPNVDELPILSPDDPVTADWFSFLTDGGNRDSDVPVDRESTPRELRAWAAATLPGDAKTRPCSRMWEAVNHWRSRIADEESSHDKITEAQWHLVQLAVEGHVGWRRAVQAVGKAWTDSVLDRDKRGITELRGEVGRGLIGALRKAKAEHDSHAGWVSPCCCDDAELQQLIAAALAPGGPWHPDTAKPWAVEPRADRTDQEGEPDQLELETDRAYRRHKANEMARRRLAAEAWHDPEDEGDLNHQIANPEPDVGHLVDGLIRARGVVQINAQYKAGKTTLASVNLPKALVTGEPFLRHFKVDFGPDECVGIWNLEVDRQDLVDWLEQIDIPEQHRSRIYPLCLRGNRSVDFRDPLAVEWAVSWFRERGITVWIIDPLSKLYRGEENSSTEFNEWWSTLEDIMRRGGVRVTVIVHHSGHSGEGRARGTSAMMGNPDVLIEYRHSGDHGELPPDGKRYLTAFGRRVNQPETKVDFDPATGELFVDAAGGSRDDDRTRALAVRLWEALVQAAQPLNQGELLKKIGRKTAGKNSGQARAAIEYAEARGWITVEKRGTAHVHSPGATTPNDERAPRLQPLSLAETIES